MIFELAAASIFAFLLVAIAWALADIGSTLSEIAAPDTPESAARNAALIARFDKYALKVADLEIANAKNEDQLKSLRGKINGATRNNSNGSVDTPTVEDYLQLLQNAMPPSETPESPPKPPIPYRG